MKFFTSLIPVLFTIPLLTFSLIAQNGDTVLTAGMDAPKFFLKDMNNAEFYSSDYYGQPRKSLNAPKDRFDMVISFFATWCVPCRKEIPELERLQKKYPAIKFFLIDVGEEKEVVEKHLKTTPISLPILLDRYGKTAEKFKVQKPGTSMAVLPTLVMISRDGKVHFYKKGYEDGDETKMENELLKLAK